MSNVNLAAGAAIGSHHLVLLADVSLEDETERGAQNGKEDQIDVHADQHLVTKSVRGNDRVDAAANEDHVLNDERRITTTGSDNSTTRVRRALPIGKERRPVERLVHTAAFVRLLHTIDD